MVPDPRHERVRPVSVVQIKYEATLWEKSGIGSPSHDLNIEEYYG